MEIAVLGWGSLLWSPRELAVATGWRPGPVLPVEFARRSADGRVTLVLVAGYPVWSTAFWAPSSFGDLDRACENLRRREGSRPGDIHCTRGRGLQTCKGERPTPASLDVSDVVGEWLASVPGLDAAVWTGLPPAAFSGRRPSTLAAEVVAYLSGLPDGIRQLAKEYVQRAPSTVRTPVREAIEAPPLRWLPR